MKRRTEFLIGLFLYVSAISFTACSGPEEKSFECPGIDVSDGGTSACLHQGALIEEGFSCPAETPHAFPADDGTVCSSDEPLPDGVVERLEERGIEPEEGEMWTLSEENSNNVDAGPADAGPIDAGDPGDFDDSICYEGWSGDPDCCLSGETVSVGPDGCPDGYFSGSECGRLDPVCESADFGLPPEDAGVAPDAG